MSIPMVQGLQLYMPSGSKHRANKTERSGKWKVQNPTWRQLSSNSHTNTHTQTMWPNKTLLRGELRALIDILSVIFGSKKLSKHCKLLFILSRTFSDSPIYRIYKFCENMVTFLDEMWKILHYMRLKGSMVVTGKIVSLEQMANDSFHCIGTDHCNYFPFYFGY